MAKELEVLKGEDEIRYQNIVEIGAKLVKALVQSGIDTPYLRQYKRDLDTDIQRVFANRRKEAAKSKKVGYEEKIKEYQAKIAKL